MPLAQGLVASHPLAVETRTFLVTIVFDFLEYDDLPQLCVIVTSVMQTRLLERLENVHDSPMSRKIAP